MGLLGCQEKQTQKFEVKPQDLLKFNPPDQRPRMPSPEFKEYLLPVNKVQATDLRTPNDYHRSRMLQLSPGVLFKQYERKGIYPPDPVQTLRALLIQPKAFKQIQVLFSDQYRHPLYFYKVANRTQTMAVMNWGFFGSIPGGDILGQRCTRQGVNCKSGIYHNSEKRTGKRTDLRYTLAITKKGQAQIFRGGLGPQSGKWYTKAMGGGILLFDRDLAPQLWVAVGRKYYTHYYLNPRYNEASIVRSGQAGDPSRPAPRSAMGIMADGSILYLQLGEGKLRLEGGATPARLAKIMKEMGAVRALMFD
ncbi:hypothetical protein COW64_25680, partial [bacterium (Candidatus Blackallbacteria) CG18_big_fil_WC_8_21_14_2_50_49_26]